VAFKSAAATPELPLLEEAASELAGLSGETAFVGLLLPAAAVEKDQTTEAPEFGGEEEKEEKACEWTPASTSIPASPRSSNRRTPSPSGEPGSASDPPSPNGSEAPTEVFEDSFKGPFGSFEGSELFSAALPPTLPAAWPSSWPSRKNFKKEAQAIEIGSGVALPACGYVPMWCWVQPGEVGTLVVPIADGEADQPPFVEGLEAEGTFMKLWCWAQPQGAAGQTTVVPCTDKGQTAPTNNAEASDAQKSPCKTDVAAKGGGYVPEWSSGPYWPFNASPTTLLIQNLSLELTQEDLLEVLDREESSGFYDFVYLRPSENSKSEAILQEAIVNVTQHKHGLQLAARLHGRRFWGVNDDRSCKVTWSFVQGLDNLVQVYRDAPSSVNGGSAQLFRKGWPVPFP
jgi:hypothetical protein